MSEQHRTIEAAIAAFARGEIVVVTDDDDRENEGDLVMAAVHATPEKMAFIIRNTAGIVCAPLPLEHARRLRLDPMVSQNNSPHHTAFTVSVDYAHGTTTGISAEDRTATVRGLANGNAGANDFCASGTCVSADRERGRRADALRPYRGGGRSLQAGAARAGRCDLRTRQ